MKSKIFLFTLFLFVILGLTKKVFCDPDLHFINPGPTSDCSNRPDPAILTSSYNGDQFSVTFWDGCIPPGGQCYTYWHYQITVYQGQISPQIADEWVGTSGYPVSRTFTLSQDICYGQFTRVHLHAVGNYTYTSDHDYYIIFYKNGQSNCSNEHFITNGSIAHSMDYDACFERNEPCYINNPYTYPVSRKRIDFTLYGSFQSTDFAVVNQDCYGWSPNNYCNNEQMWGTIKEKYNDHVTFSTYVWFINIGNTGSWWPCAPEYAVVAYNEVYNPPPILNCAANYQWPACIYRGENGAVTAVFSQGEYGAICDWTPMYRPSYFTDDATTNHTKTIHLHNNYGAMNNPLDGGDGYVYYYNLTAHNNGSSTCTTVPNGGVVSSQQYRPGGCPWIFVQDIDTNFYPDNNLLHRSEFPENSGVDISDYYRLNNIPAIFDNKINLKIIETNSDIDYIDKVTLFAIDHPKGTELGITESNQIVTYDTTAVSTSRYAVWDSVDNITKYVDYYYSGDTVVVGAIGDSVSATNMNNVGGGNGDSLAIIIGIGGNPDWPIQPINKTQAGVVNIYTNGTPQVLTMPFARRENVSEVIIPYAPSSSVLDSAIFTWSRDFELDWLGSTRVNYANYTMNELQLIGVSHPSYDDGFSYLIFQDQNYIVLDSLYQLDLSFSNIAPPQLGYVRDYVIKTDGRYVTMNNPGTLINQVIRNNNQTPTRFNLYQNYPNPFNPTTKIKFDISKSANVSIKVFDLLGREVSTLINEIKQPGSYEVEFNGSKFASGLYFYKIEAGNFISVKKMVLIK